MGGFWTIPREFLPPVKSMYSYSEFCIYRESNISTDLSFGISSCAVFVSGDITLIEVHGLRDCMTFNYTSYALYAYS